MNTCGNRSIFFMCAAILVMAIAIGLTVAMDQEVSIALTITELLTPSAASPQLATTIAHTRLLFLLALVFVPLFSVATFQTIKKLRDREFAGQSRPKTLGQIVFCVVTIGVTTGTFFFDEGKNCRICVEPISKSKLTAICL